VAGRLVGNFPQAFSHVSLVNSASKLMGQEKPTSDHVILGLARRSLTRGKGLPVERHLSGVTAQSMVSKLVRNAGSGTKTGAATLLQSAVGPSAGKAGVGKAVAPAKRRGKPTTKPSERKSRPLATKAPVKNAVAKKLAAKKAAVKKLAAKKTSAKRAPVKGSAATKRAPATRGTANPGAPDQEPAKAAGAKKAPATRAAAKKAAATKASAKKASAKKASAKKAPAKKARAAAQGR
jgi:hypothetical protein